MNSAENMSKEMKKELRKLLTGQTIRRADGLLVAIPEGKRLLYHGVSDNTGRRIVSRSAVLNTAPNVDTEVIFHQIVQALQRIGLLVDMETWPEALCALKRFFLTKAVILCVAPNEDGAINVVAYTGRSMLSGFCCSHSIRQLQKFLTEQAQ